MANQIAAVRVRSVPAWMVQSGIVVWCASKPLDVPGYRTIWHYSGPSRDGKGTIHLSFVQPRSTRPFGDKFVDDLRAWALSWMADVGACI